MTWLSERSGIASIGVVTSAQYPQPASRAKNAMTRTRFPSDTSISLLIMSRSDAPIRNRCASANRHAYRRDRRGARQRWSRWQADRRGFKISGVPEIRERADRSSRRSAVRLKRYRRLDLDHQAVMGALFRHLGGVSQHLPAQVGQGHALGAESFAVGGDQSIEAVPKHSGRAPGASDVFGRPVIARDHANRTKGQLTRVTPTA